MKELNRKVFITVFSIISLFIVLSVIVYNTQIYKKSYDDVYRNLTFMRKKNDFNHVPKEFDNPNDGKNLDNMMIMDYEVYTIKLNDGKIEKIINHSSTTSDFNIEEIAKKIINSEEKINIGNLYNNKYSYNYRNDTINVINTENINNRLLKTLMISIILLIVIEIIIYYISKILTKKITKPAYDALDKQKTFIADASHELKTPLAVIMASSDLLVSDKKNDKYIENIKYESERMNNLIKNLLDLSKLENGISSSTYKDENISKIVEKISSTFEGVAYENNIKIKTNIEENIILRCSKDEIEKLISIILDNAIKHSYEKSTIKVNLHKEKNNINIEIINRGDPINIGDEEKIFERFYRADKSRKRDSNRYGLGLVIAKNIAINHNGEIKAYSRNGNTTFKIVLKK